MGHRQTPEQWIRENPEKVKFVRKYLEKKIGLITENSFPYFGLYPEDADEREVSLVLRALRTEMAAGGNPAYAQLYFDKLRRAWDRAEYAKKHATVLHSFYLDKNTNTQFNKALTKLKKTKSELISYLLEKELKEASSPVNLVALHQQVKKLNLQKAEIEAYMATAFDEINQFVSELRLKEYEYEIVKEKLGTDIDKIIEQHSDQIQKFKDSSAKVNIVKKIVTRRLKAKSKSKIVPLE